jgi:membrane protease subunit (stomatin/prohibitin family)
MGETITSVLNLPGEYDTLSEGLRKRLEDDFGQFGLGLSQLYVNSITPPPEVQQAIDDKSRLGVFDDLNRLLKMKAAMALEKASETQGEAGAGLGLGLGVMAPTMLAGLFRGSTAQGPSEQKLQCPACQQAVARDARFCPHCGHALLVFNHCPHCSANISADTRFCPQCGKVVEHIPQAKKCSQCGSENLSNSIYCNQCGVRI